MLVISKSGGTPETRNGMLEADAAYAAAGLDFGDHAVAVTGDGSSWTRSPWHEQLARALPDVGLGRRPHRETSAVGLLPGRAAGLDIDGLLAGAARHGRGHPRAGRR